MRIFIFTFLGILSLVSSQTYFYYKKSFDISRYTLSLGESVMFGTAGGLANVAFDPSTNYIFYRNSGIITRAFIDGSGQVTHPSAASRSDMDLHFNTVTNKLYWIQSGIIYSSNSDFSNTTALYTITTGSGSYYGLFLDAGRGFMYYSYASCCSGIYRVNVTDFTHRTIDNFQEAHNVAVYLSTGDLYVARNNALYRYIYANNYQKVTLLTGAYTDGVGISIDQSDGTIYITAYSNSRILIYYQNGTYVSFTTGSSPWAGCVVKLTVPFTTGQITSGLITTSQVTSASLTTSPLTTSPLTTSPLTTSPLTTARLTTSPLTTSPLTSAPLTTSPLTTSPLTTSPLTTSPLTTSELTTSPLTTSPLTTSPLTTSPLTTSPVSTGSLTTNQLTTSPLTSSPLTTNPLTSGRLTTSPLTSSPLTTSRLTTSPLTTSPVTTSPLTTSPLTSSPLTTSPVTTSHVTTSPLTTSPVTTTSPLTSGPLFTAPVTSSRLTSEQISTSRLTTSSLTSGELVTTEFETNPQVTTSTPPVVISTSFDNAKSELSSDTSNNIMIIAIVVGVSLFAIIGALIAVIVVATRKNKPLPETEMLPVSVKRSDEDFRPPQSINHVDIRRLLTTTSDGIEVYIGDWNETPVILKKVMNKEAIHLLQQEASTLAKIQHPNCVLFLGTYVDDDGNNYIVTEYIARDLRQLLQQEREKLTPLDLVDISIDVAKGLAYLEERSVVHRDIALRNILVSEIDDKYTAKVSEFGMSRSGDTSVYTNNSTHIPIKWRAIEVVRGGVHTQKSDVWSFGVLLYEIFSYGKEPFDWLSNRDAYACILKGEKLPKPEGCKEYIYDVMKSCWNDDPEQRPSFIKLVAVLKNARVSIKKGDSAVSTMDQPTDTSAKHEDAYEDVMGKSSGDVGKSSDQKNYNIGNSESEMYNNKTDSK